MKKSVLTPTPWKGRRNCQFEPMDGERCRERATVNLHIKDELSNPAKTLESDTLYCQVHARRVISYYEMEWENHPEMFEDD